MPGRGDVGRGCFALPAHEGGIVVGTGVADTMAGIGVGQVIGCFPGIKGELQHFHTRQAGFLQKLTNFRGQVAQILGDKLDVGESGGQNPNEVHARALYPAADLGGGLPIGHCPIAFQAAEVVDAENVVQPGGARDAPDPPGITVGLHGVPVVEGITPELALGSEIVRRHAGHLRGHVPLIQLERPGIGPHVGGVHGHIDGQVADDADALFVGVDPERLPLAEEQVLDIGEQADILRKLCAVAFHRLGTAETDILIGPFCPGFHPETAFNSHEQSVIRQPSGIFF